MSRREFAPTTLPAALDHLIDVCPPGPLPTYDRTTRVLMWVGVAIAAALGWLAYLGS